MLSETKKEDLFCEYYARWIMVYKKGAIRKVTMDKYLMTQKWLEKLIPELKIREMNRIAYQQLLNDYTEYHERQTTMDFHHQLKGAILDAVDAGAKKAQEACAEGADMGAMLRRAAEGAKEGVKATEDMLPKYGKAAVFSAKAKGVPDQGAVAGQYFLEGLGRYFL